MRTRPAQITLSIICLLVGIMLVTQFRTQTRIQRSVLTESATNQAMIVSNLYDSNVALRKEVDNLQQQLAQYERTSELSDVTTMADELNRMRIATGLSEVSGPGVELRVVASLTREDVQDLINELRNAGAEALAVNRQRLVAQSAVIGEQAALAVNGELLGAPYLFQVVGHPDTIERALVRKGGVLAIMQNTYPDALFVVAKQDKIALPAYALGYQWANAKPADK